MDVIESIESIYESLCSRRFIISVTHEMFLMLLFVTIAASAFDFECISHSILDQLQFQGVKAASVGCKERLAFGSDSSTRMICWCLEFVSVSIC
jgi:hypothetical protein